MAEMRVATTAQHLRPLHEERVVFLSGDGLWLNGLPIARPACARFELMIRAEELLSTSYALVSPFLLVVPVRAGERALRPLLARDLVLFGRELLFPFLVGFDYFRCHGIGRFG